MKMFAIALTTLGLLAAPAVAESAKQDGPFASHRTAQQYSVNTEARQDRAATISPTAASTKVFNFEAGKRSGYGQRTNAGR